MKKDFFLNIITIFLLILCAKAQVIPIDGLKEFLNEDDAPDDLRTYSFKDVNDVLMPFVGIWEGTQENKDYMFYIRKKLFLGDPSDEDEPKEWDKLTIRYLIKDKTTGNEIFSTLSIPDDNHEFVIQGSVYAISPKSGVGTYSLNYEGEDSLCGQLGSIYIVISNITKKMSLFLLPSRPWHTGQDDENCDDFEQLLPTANKPIILTKR